MRNKEIGKDFYFQTWIKEKDPIKLIGLIGNER